MNFILDVIVGLFKLIIFLLGLLMLVGGGVCAFNMAIMSFESQSEGWGFFALVGLVTAGLGWLLLKALFSKPKPKHAPSADSSASTDEKIE